MREEVLIFLICLIFGVIGTALIYVLEEPYPEEILTNPYREWGEREVFTIRNKHLAALGILILWIILAFIFDRITKKEEGGEK